MDYCPYCGKALEEQCSFCPYCGKALAKTSNRSKILLPILAAAILIIAAVFLPIRSSKPFSEDTRAIAEASRSVVTINTYDINNVSTGGGSGFAAIEEGIIITNFHVIDGDTHRIEAVTENRIVMDADSIIAYDKEKDIAILRFNDCTLAPLPTADGMALERGEPLTAIGSPIGFNNMVSTGVLSQYLDDVSTGLIRLLFTTSISHGSSGGALFDNEGNVVGVTSGGFEDGNEVYYAMPFTYVTELYENRSPADEITPAKLWEKNDHIYTVDYVLAFPRQLNGKTIQLSGYVSAVNHDLYLQASPENRMSLRPTNELSKDEKDLLWKTIRERLNTGDVLLCQRESRGSFPDDLTGKYVTLRGKVTVFTENVSGDDVRFIVSEVIASE